MTKKNNNNIRIWLILLALIGAVYYIASWNTDKSISIGYSDFVRLVNAGEIESISINGKTEFEQGDSFAVDAEVKIVYHDFKKNNPNK